MFSPRKPRFRRRCAPLKVSLWRRMSADATGIFILTGDNALPLTAFALAFSPVCPLSENDGKTTTLLRKKLVRLFSPREPLFRRRCAPLKVSLWRRMSAVATIFFILTGDNALLLTAFALAFSPVCPLSENDGKTTPSLRKKLVRLFSPREPRFRRRVRSS